MNHGDAHLAEETESTTVPHEEYFVMHVFTHVQKPFLYSIHFNSILTVQLAVGKNSKMFQATNRRPTRSWITLILHIDASKLQEPCNVKSSLSAPLLRFQVCIVKSTGCQNIRGIPAVNEFWLDLWRG